MPTIDAPTEQHTPAATDTREPAPTPNGQHSGDDRPATSTGPADDDALRSTAIHEAGHAIAHRALGGLSLNVTLDLAHRGANSRNGVNVQSFGERKPFDIRRMMIVTAAGAAAERMVYGADTDTGDSVDLHVLARLANKLHGVLAPHRILHAEIQTAVRRADALVRLYAEQIEQFAESLIEQHRMIATINTFTTDIDLNELTPAIAPEAAKPKP